ncbi:MAG: hypothetical protein KDA68_21260, partial [Planctomycetaceae bacterium]|nr:hypothetical protein [Planctomycetaceae bacterium]
PSGERREGRGPGGGESGGPDGAQGGGPGSGGPGGGGRNRDPAARFAQMDADGNGKLEGDEISERMRPFISAIDKNGDGAIDLEEMKAGFSAMRRPGGEGGGPPAGGQPSSGNGAG